MGVNFNIDKLLEPYSQAGTEKNPRKLTLEDISGELINRFRIPHDVAGAAIWRTFKKLSKGTIRFEGDGSFDGKARQLIMYIRADAAKAMSSMAKQEVVRRIAKKTACMNLMCACRTGVLKRKTRLSRFMDFLMRPRRLFFLPTWRI